MEPILLPKIEIKKEKDPKKIEVILEPCFQGYGTTIGNALRRVLLSSIPGAAVTAVKIKGANHEFSTIPLIKEDVVQIMLNLKQLRLKIHSTEQPIRLHLCAQGEKVVTAKDIEPSSAVEIANPDLVIAEITDQKGELDLEIFAEEGRGYITAEDKQKRGLELGMIAVDAIYTPVRNVSFKVEPVRVGQITNFDRLILNIETDGTITPEDAFKKAAQILIEHFQLVERLGEELSAPSIVSTDEAIVNDSAETPGTVEIKSELADQSANIEGEKKRGRKRSKKSE